MERLDHSYGYGYGHWLKHEQHCHIGVHVSPVSKLHGGRGAADTHRIYHDVRGKNKNVGEQPQNAFEAVVFQRVASDGDETQSAVASWGSCGHPGGLLGKTHDAAVGVEAMYRYPQMDTKALVLGGTNMNCGGNFDYGAQQVGRTEVYIEAHAGDLSYIDCAGDDGGVYLNTAALKNTLCLCRLEP